MLLFTLEKSRHTRSDKYFSLCSQIIALGNLAMATLVDELFKYQPWAMSYNVLVLTCSPERDGAVGLRGGPEDTGDTGRGPPPPRGPCGTCQDPAMRRRGSRCRRSVCEPVLSA